MIKVSCIFIGRCYEQQNNIDEAKYYFEKVALLDNNRTEEF